MIEGTAARETLAEEVAGLDGERLAEAPRTSIVATGAVALASRIAVIVMQALLGIITARLLQPAQRGIYIIPGIEAGLVIAAFSGLSVGTSYFMLNKGAGRAVLRSAAGASVLFVGAGSVVIVILALSARELWSALPAIASLLPMAIIYVCSGYFLGRARVITNTLVMLNYTTLMFVFVTVALLVVARSATVAIIAWLVSLVAAAAVSLMVLARDRKADPGVGVRFSAFVRYALTIGATNLVSLLNYRVDVYIVALLTKPADLAVYTLAVSAAESVGVFTQVVPQISLPEIGRLEGLDSARYTARCARTNVALAFPVCAALFFAAPWLVTTMYGESFAGAIVPLRVLLVGAFALAPCSLLTTYFTIKLGRPRLAFLVVSGSSIISAIICIVLIPRIGILGGATATAVSYLLGEVFALIYFSRVSGTPLLASLILRRGDLAPLAELVRSARQRCGC